MLTEKDLKKYHEAAKMIEADGVEAYHSVTERFGSETANLLIVAFLRREFGSMETFPAREEIIPKVDACLIEHGILVKSKGETR